LRGLSAQTGLAVFLGDKNEISLDYGLLYHFFDNSAGKGRYF
jgi:hypothetical protein